MSAGELSLETLSWARLQAVPQLRDVDLLQCTQDQQKVDDRNGPLGALPGKVGCPRVPHFMKGGKGRERTKTDKSAFNFIAKRRD